MRSASDSLKRVTLELGGKSPNIVFSDADVDAAVRGAINGIFYGKGEVCNAGSRLFVESPLQAEFLEKLVARARKMQPADPLDPKTRLGAIVSHEQMESVLSYIETGKKEAELISGGNRITPGGQPRMVSRAHNLRRREERYEDRSRRDLWARAFRACF